MKSSTSIGFVIKALALLQYVVQTSPQIKDDHSLNESWHLIQFDKIL